MNAGQKKNPPKIASRLADNCLRLRESMTKKTPEGRSFFTMADVAFGAKISAATYDRIENAKTDTTLTTLVALAKVFHVEPYELIK